MLKRRRTSKGRFTKNKSHKRRRNGAGKASKAAARAAKAASKAVKAVKAAPRKKSHKKAPVSYPRRIRPTIIVSKSGGYSRPPRSKYFTSPRMVNPRRRRLSRRRNSSSIMSTVKRVLTVSTLSGYLSIGGGILAGAMLSKMLNTGMVPFMNVAIPATVTETLGNKYVRPFHGILHIVLGTVIASKVRNKYIRDAGMGLAALGGYDLLSQALSFAGVMDLPSLSGMNVNMLGRTSYTGMNVNLLGGGMNVDLMGDARSADAESGYLVDNINDMIS